MVVKFESFVISPKNSFLQNNKRPSHCLWLIQLRSSELCNFLDLVMKFEFTIVKKGKKER